jgi:hypothetical protein
MMEAARTSETSVDNYFTRQYIPEDSEICHWLIYKTLVTTAPSLNFKLLQYK